MSDLRRLRNKAAKCRWHASLITDLKAQEELGTLAAEYERRADALKDLPEASYGAVLSRSGSSTRSGLLASRGPTTHPSTA